MNSLILVYKNRTETMAVCMDRIRTELSISSEIPMTYAGRLDPMAEGLVIFLCGSMRFQKDKFMKLSKTYSIGFIPGIETDTYDVLGLIQNVSDSKSHYSIADLEKNIQLFQPTGTFNQSFPSFSSRKVFGKSLFQHALDNNEEIPEQSHDVTIFGYSNIKQQSINRDELVQSITNDIKKVSGEFRQNEIIESWKKTASELPSELIIYSLDIECSSGFYVRQWVHDFGTFQENNAVTFSIIRGTIDIFTMSMLNGESYRVFDEHDPLIHKLTI